MEERAFIRVHLCSSVATILIALSPLATGQSVGNESLQSLTDSKLMSELADRGLNSLLDRYFEVHHTPQSQQDAVKSMQALRELSNPKLTNMERQQKIRQIADGITVMLPSLHDPARLAKDAAALLENGVVRDVNLLEYWGDNPATQARLRPVAEAVHKMLGQAAQDAKARADEIANKITPANQETIGPQWDQMNTLATSALYSQNMMVYDLALAMPQSQRASVVDPALQYLGDLDTPDTQVQPRVRVMMGKLNLAKGNYDEAMKILDSVSTDTKIQPKPTPEQQYEARYFRLVAEMLGGHLPEASSGLEELITWQKSAMPRDDASQKGVAAAAEMLRYRIYLAQAAAATDPAARQSADDAATKALLKLSTERPDLRGIIFQQLADRMPKDTPIQGMDPLLLQGVMARAYNEAIKPTGSFPDKQLVQRGLDACAEVARRRGSAGFTPELVDEAARLTPVLVEAMGNRIEAATAYLKYAQDNAVGHTQAAQGALDDAGRLIFELRKLMPENLDVSNLYDRFLPVAINPPFSRKELAFLYGQRLRLQNKPQEAIKALQMVPKQDKNYASAQYATMQALQDLLAIPKLPESQRMAIAGELVKQTQQVRNVYGDSEDAASRERAAIATLTEAKAVGADLHQPKKTLAVLADFERSVAGTPDEKILVGDALLTRVNAHMAMGDLKKATDTLVTLLNSTGGAQGADYVRGLLDRLDQDLDKAQAAHDTKAMRDIARSEADLSGFLVEWAKNNNTPEIRNFTYRYMVFDARTKRLVGELSEDDRERHKLLQVAMDAYQQLLKPENAKLYKATLDQKKIASGEIDADQPDPNVQFGIALTNYDLGNYLGTAEFLGTLLNTGKLGGPTLLVQDPSSNEQKVVTNDVYWESTYKLYRSNYELSKQANGPSLDATKQGLKNLLVRGGIPEKWQDSFEELRKQIVPDFDMAALTAPATQPTTRNTEHAASK
jgi:tetratricopeptide (TPR) repeat protein